MSDIFIDGSLHPHDRIVQVLEQAVRGEVSLDAALEAIDQRVIRPENGPRWDFVSTGIFRSLAQVSRRRSEG